MLLKILDFLCLRGRLSWPCHACLAHRLYGLEKDGLQVVDFGYDSPATYHHLSVGKGVIWSDGEEDIMSFDGKTWTIIV